MLSMVGIQSNLTQRSQTNFLALCFQILLSRTSKLPRPSFSSPTTFSFSFLLRCCHRTESTHYSLHLLNISLRPPFYVWQGLRFTPSGTGKDPLSALQIP